MGWIGLDWIGIAWEAFRIEVRFAYHELRKLPNI